MPEVFQNQTCRFDLPEYTGKEKYIVQKMEVAEQYPHWSIDCFWMLNRKVGTLQNLNISILNVSTY